MSIPIVAILKSIGAQESLSSHGPVLRLPVGLFEVEAHEGRNSWLQPVVQLGAVFTTSRTLELFEYTLPQVVESEEQALALLAYALSDRVPADLKPQWLLRGELLYTHLPWLKQQAREREEREKAAAEYRQRPHCEVQREWLRPGWRQLREAGAFAPDQQVTELRFEGSVLRIQWREAVLAFPASGADWPFTVRVRTKGFRLLPQRIMRDPVAVGIWDKHLEFDRVSIPLLDSPNLQR